MTETLPGLVVAGVLTTPSPSVTITPTRVSGLAPFGVFFAARPQGFGGARPSIELAAKWSFGDSGTWSELGNDFAPGADRNVAYGFNTGHTFETPGTYTVTVEVTDGSTTVSESIEITVDDPDVFFSGSSTAVFAADGDFTGAPTGAVQFTDLGTFFDEIFNGGGHKRYLFKRGEVIDASTAPSFPGGSIKGNVSGRDTLDPPWQPQIGAWGSGARPVIHNLGFFAQRLFAGQHITFRDLELGDPLYEASGNGTNTFPVDTGITIFPDSTEPEPWKVLATVHNCKVDGTEIGIQTQSGGVSLVVTNCHVTNWQNFGMFVVPSNNSAVRGCRIEQSVDASTGDGQKEPGTGGIEWPDHGPIRLTPQTGPDRYGAAVSQNRMFSRNGWSSEGQAHQPCIRFNTGQIADVWGSIAANQLEGGWSMLDAVGSADPPLRAVNLQIVGNYMLGTANTQAFTTLAQTGVGFYDNICVKPAVPSEFHPGNFEWVYWNQYSGSDNGAEDVLCRVANNTFVDLRTDAMDSGKTFNRDPAANSPAPAPTNVQVSNNIYHEPNRSPADVPYAPLTLAPAEATPLYDASRFNGVLTDATTGTPAGTAAGYRPLGGSAALDAAGGFAFPLDIAGTPRDATPSLGAYETAGTVADTAAPVLSQVVDAADGTSAMTASVDTDEGTGTLYWVVTTSATAPDAAEVRAGQDHVGAAAVASGAQPVPVHLPGTQGISASGLTGGTTYHLHVMQEDWAGNRSAVASGDGFTP